MKSKLILIEGLPGSGKSSTTVHLGESLSGDDISCRWFLEDAADHPIDLLDFALNDLSTQLVPLWESFVHEAQRDPGVTIIESRLWQNTCLFMYMADYPVEEIVELQDRVNQALAPLSPILIYLHQADIKKALGHLQALRTERSLLRDVELTSRYAWFQSRGKGDFTSWFPFFKAWFEVAEVLYDRWPYDKCKIESPHDHWEVAYSKINEFLEKTLF